MTANRKTAISTGILFILATVMGVLTTMMSPIIGSEDYLTGMSENSSTVQISTVFVLIMAGAVVAIAVVIYPILKRENQTLAVGYLAARIIEGVALGILGFTWLLLVSLSAEFVQAPQPEGTHFQTLGALLIYSGTVAVTFGVEIVFSVSALILNYVFFRSKIVPRFISVWGFAAALLYLALGVMKIMGLSVFAVGVALTVPIALNEMVLAVWLIVKGFTAPVGQTVLSN